MTKTRPELLDLFARQVADWLARFPAEAGTIRTRVCAALKFTDLEFANWIRASKDQKAIAALEGAIAKTVIQPKIAVSSPSSDEPPPGLMDGVDSIFENAENSETEKGIEEASPAFGVAGSHQDAEDRADWLDSQFPAYLRAVASQSKGSQRTAGVVFLFRQLALNLSGRDAATEAFVREAVCGQIDELKKADYERCMREAKAKLKSEKNERGDAASADGDISDLGGLARKFLQSQGADRALLRWRESWYEWTKEIGYYAEKDKEWMPTRATLWLYEQGLPIGMQQVTNFMNALQAMAYVADVLKPPCWLRNVDGVVRRAGGIYVSMANGILDLESVRFEMGDTIVHAPLIEHTPDFFTLNALPYAFDPEAGCPQLEAALEMWQPRGEKDPEGLGQRLLQDFAGYIFEPGQPHQVMLINHGPGNDGKSQYKEMLIALAGVDNTTALGLEALDPAYQHERQDLIGKILWTIPDAAQLDKIGEGTLKAITGGDRITIPRKYKSAITGPVDAKVVISCNEPPGFRDRSEGVWRRLLLLHWEPVTGKIIRDFAKKLIAEEMPGVFIWALRGWLRVRESGFSKRGLLIENVQAFRREAQAELEFFDQCVDLELGEVDTKTAGVSVEDLIKEYKNWCGTHNLTPYAHPNTMGRALKRWVRWQLDRAEPPWEADKIAEFLKDSNFKDRRGEGGKRRKDYYVRITLLQDDEAQAVMESGGWRMSGRTRSAPPRTLYE